MLTPLVAAFRWAPVNKNCNLFQTGPFETSSGTGCSSCFLIRRKPLILKPEVAKGPFTV